jgi:hypothetical protein
MLTPGTLYLLRDLLATQTLHVGAPDFPDTARAVLAARDELDAAIATSSGQEGQPCAAS